MSGAARTILHLDLDAFYCSVEETRDPMLRGKAFAVGGSAEGRGVVCSCSYEARRFGVRSAMPMGRAVALCPHLICLRTQFPAYRAASTKVMAILRAVTPLVEQISIDEAFLDVTALGTPGLTIARRLQAEIHETLGLACSLGIASNKLVAKIATDAGKARGPGGQSPQALLEVPPGAEAAFLAPLPVGALWGVGPKTAGRLEAMGLRTIGDIAGCAERELAARFGEHGRDMVRRARGEDDRPLVTERAAKSISQETTFPRDVTDGAVLRAAITEQTGHICRKLRREGLCAGTVRLKIRWANFTTLTRQLSLATPASDEATFLPLTIRLFDHIWTPGRRVRLIGVGAGSLSTPLQLSLWDTGPAEEAAKEKRVQAALAAVTARLGAASVVRGSDLNRTQR